MKSRALLFSVVGVFMLGGCAFTQSKLDVTYREATASKGPLSLVTSQTIEIGEFSDKRSETDKIGYKKNGFGMKTANIVSSRPVGAIVRDALAVEFERNGHRLGQDPGAVVLTGDVTTFWFDVQPHFWTVDFLGTVAVELRMRDARTGALVLTRTYQGHYTEKSTGGLDGTWERVMNTALERMVREVSTDPRLIDVLKQSRSDTASVPAR